MKESHYNWNFQKITSGEELFIEKMKVEGYPDIFSKLVYNRGIKEVGEVDSFLTPSLADLHDPFLFYDMEKTVTRIQLAIQEGQKIFIYGDYDADGITSTTVLKEAIELIGGIVDYYIPNRFKDGYGPNQEVYKHLIEDEGAELIITVDNGVTGHDAIEFATEQGVDVIVTDHHELPEELPKAFSIIHPRHPLGDYPDKELAGVGVSFKLATALLEEIPSESLDLVAIGTVADLVPLTGENRTLVKFGIEVLKQTERIGLHSLADIASFDLHEATSEMISFQIAPRLNALGRIGDAFIGVDFLSTFDEEEAKKIANDIQIMNTKRQDLVKEITTEAFDMISQLGDKPIYVLAKNGWHEGVLGIVASKVVQETNRPAIILNIDETTGIAKGSARSIQSINIYDCLSNLDDHLITFGGHHMAAGLSLNKEELPALISNLELMLRDSISSQTKDDLMIDAKIDIDMITIEFIESLNKLAPFGNQNPSPYFLVEASEVLNTKQIGSDLSHLKGQLSQTNHQVDYIAFGKGSELVEFEGQEDIQVVGQLSINEWNGLKKPQFMLKDYKIEDTQLFDIRGKKIPENKNSRHSRAYLVFNEETETANFKPEDTTYLLDSLDNIDMSIINKYDEVIIVDCPYNMMIASYVFKELIVPRIYFYIKIKQDHYLTGLPKRAEFGKLFKLIKAQSSIDVRHRLGDISQYLQIDKPLLIFMIEVFFELGFVTIEDGLMKKVDNPENKSLEESQTYQAYLEKIDMEKLFLYSNISDIGQWISKQEENE